MPNKENSDMLLKSYWDLMQSISDDEFKYESANMNNPYIEEIKFSFSKETLELMDKCKDLLEHRCEKCGMQGPTAYRPDNASALWNVLPRRLKWTKEKPTQDGWYWVKHNVATIPMFVHIVNGECELRPSMDILVDVGYEFAGPIPEPEPEK